MMITSRLKWVSQVLIVMPLFGILTVAGCSRGASNAANSVVPVPLTDDGRKLLKAVDADDLKTVQEMVSADPALLRVNGELGSPLLYACNGPGDPEMVAFLLKAGADVNALDDRGNTALNIKVRGKSSPTKTRIVQLLLDGGANPNARTKGGASTPLHIAAWAGNLEVVKLLIAHHADLKALDGQGKTALQVVKSTYAKLRGGDAATQSASSFLDMQNYPAIMQVLESANKPATKVQPTPLAK